MHGLGFVAGQGDVRRDVVRCGLVRVSRLGGVRCSLVGSCVVWFGEDFMA